LFESQNIKAPRGACKLLLANNKIYEEKRDFKIEWDGRPDQVRFGKRLESREHAGTQATAR